MGSSFTDNNINKQSDKQKNNSLHQKNRSLFILNGWVQGILHCPSANFNERESELDINLLVIHNISLPPGEFGGGYVQSFFCNKLDARKHAYFSEIATLKVSAHLLIERCGAITQFVSFNDRAWHAGVSCFNGRDNCNDFSIGIELEGCDEQAYTAAQYHALQLVTKAIMLQYPAINIGRITGHSDIAPGRKTDPGGAFDWRLYRAGVGGDEQLF